MFSVIIPLFNKKDFVTRAIDSVFTQSFTGFELIVVDDGSTDGGGEFVASKYGSKLNLIQQTNKGVSTARNVGINQAMFPWIAFLDADDYWHVNYLEFVSKVIAVNPVIGMVGTRYSSTEIESTPILHCFKLDHYFRRAVRNTMYFTSATVIKKDFFSNNPGFDPQIKLGEDIDLWLRASIFYGDGYYINNTLVYYGQEDAQKATNKIYPLNETLISKIVKQNYHFSARNRSNFIEKEFLDFRDKWIYFTLFPHYRLKSNERPIADTLNSLPGRYFLVRAIYLLPFGLLHRLFATDFFSGWFRKYMKFCFRFIYT
ncbi:glycosyltransferase family 2 protein [Algoriphagus terrigena]|uniref:glycosyltransferase family 2 protein n=1 Tax=Algoriphagus terrigena TaxID=344884 RepID=UPI00042869D6|nr:glycosyltransferase family A protein [Algoriphagus terrigena]